MALGHFGPQGMRFVSGAPARGRPIRVEDGAGSLIQLYNDPDGLSPAPNPKLTDEQGNLFFYALPGEYFLEVDVARIPILVEEVGGGGGGGVEEFTYTQPTPAATWTIDHFTNSYREPVVFLDDAPTVPVYTDVTFPSSNQTVLQFDAPVTGRAVFA